jgi:hypothetical protein
MTVIFRTKITGEQRTILYSPGSGIVFGSKIALDW